MMKAFGRLEHLKTVIIRGPFRAPFPLSSLSCLLAEARELVRFSLLQMTVVGSAAGFEAFGRLSVSRHIPSLEVFDIDMIHILRRPDGPPIDRPILNPLLKTLALCKKLNVLLLGGCDPSSLHGTITWDAYEPLFCSKTITRVSLVNLPISFHQLRGITKLLETNDCLRHLCISCGSMAAEDSEKPEEPTAVDGQAKFKGDRPEAQSSLVSMLNLNKTLAKIILFIPGLDQDEETSMGIFDAIGKSPSLKAVYLGSLDNMTPRCNQSLMHLLHKNFVLEEFGFVSANQGSQSYPCSMDAMREMSMLLRLNKDASRGKLLQDKHATRKDWVDSLAKIGDDLDCIYHLLSLNPALLCTENGKSATKRRLCKRRLRDDKCAGLEMARKRTRLYRAVKYTRFSYR
jgi:hypothetical protein